MAQYYAQKVLKPITKDFLKRVYCKGRLSTWAIETKYGFTRSRVYNALKRFDLPRRNLAQSHILYSRADFGGDECEKAYLIGFAMGDLRVRNHGGERSETISIACGSTKQAQIELIRDLFSKYGRVWIGKPNYRGVVNIEAYVNKSFSFLLKSQRNYAWCKESPRHFFAFLAGFTDAEGSFFLTRNQARIAWGNYDIAALTFIQSGLNKYGIQSPNMVCDALKGTIGTNGYPRNGTYCHLTCARKDVIRDIVANLEMYIRHKDKKVALAKIRRNLVARGVSL